MKRLFLAGWMVVVLAGLASGQTMFSNNIVINSPPDDPPQGWADVYYNGNTINVSYPSPFSFFGVSTYTNRGPMNSPTGFIFDYRPSNGGSNHPAGLFGNANTGIVTAGSNAAPLNTTPPAQIGVFPAVYPQLRISATNIYSPGVLGAAIDGLVALEGDSVNLVRGSLHVETFGDSIGTTFPIGIFAVPNGWGVGNENGRLTANNFIPATSPFAPQSGGGLTIPAAKVFANVILVTPTNVDYQIVFVPNDASVDVRFSAASTAWRSPVVRWQFSGTNSFGKSVTNAIFLTDTFPTLPTLPAIGLKLYDYTTGGQVNFAPSNYTISTAMAGYNTLPTANTNYNPFFLSRSNAFDTNPPFSANTTFSMWHVQSEPFTFRPDPANPNQSFSNVPGRIEINARQLLNMDRVRVDGPNYISFNATNHFVTSANAQIAAYSTRMDLGTTNGQLSISNLVVPYLERFNGTIDMWSAIWDNTFDSNIIVTNMSGGSNVLTTNTITYSNHFHVLLVNSALATTVSPICEQVNLRSTNVVISDILNITSNLLITAQNVTIGSNSPPAATPPGQPYSVGEINLQNASILWSPSFPLLQNFTNAGLVTIPNTAFFSHRADPNFPSPGDTPYARFVNHGGINSSGGNIIWANYFESTGLGGFPDNGSINSGSGNLSVTANTALVGNCLLTAFNQGDMAITSGTLTVSNSILVASGLMTLTVTTNLTDGNTLGNIWEFGDGFFLPVKPATGDLLGTTLQLDTLPNEEVNILWAGEDRGAFLTGYSNNVAVGHLILNGGDADSSFHFIGAGPGASNAIYVDLLELQSAAGGADALNVDPNFAIYYNRATNSTTHKDLDLEALTGGVQFHHVTHSGLFNVASPLLTGNSPTLSIVVTNQPAHTALVSWPAVPNATNGLYFSTSFNGPNWTLVTNIVQGGTSTTLTVPVSTQAGSRYYQLRASPVQ